MNRKPLDFLKGVKKLPKRVIPLVKKVKLPKVDTSTLVLRAQLAVTKLSFTYVALLLLLTLVVCSAITALYGTWGHFAPVMGIVELVNNLGIPAMIALCWFTRTEKNVKRERAADLAWIGLSIALPQLVYHSMYLAGFVTRVNQEMWSLPPQVLSMVCSMWVAIIVSAVGSAFVFLKSRNVLLPRKAVK